MEQVPVTTNLLILSPYFAALFVSLLVTFYIYRNRHMRGASTFLILAVAETIYVAGFLLETFSPTLSQKIFWDDVQWPSTLIIPGAYLYSIIEYSQLGEKVRGRLRVGIFAFPVLLMILVILDPWLKLIRPTAELITENGVTSLYYPFTPVMYAFGLYIYITMTIGLVLLIRFLVKTRDSIRRARLFVLLLGLLTIFTGTMISLFELAPPYLRDVDPLTIGLANLFIAIGIYRVRLFNVVPIAKELVIESMDAAVIVLDTQNDIVDANASALKIVNKSKTDVIGEDFHEIFAEFPEFLKKYGDQTNTEDLLTLNLQGRINSFSLTIAPISNGPDQQLGRLISLNNITSRVELESQLQEKANQLLVANQLLQTEKTKIEQVANEIAALRNLSENLQSSKTVKDVENVIASHLSLLFANTNGALYLSTDNTPHLSLTSSWGGITVNPILQPDDCIGLRKRLFHVHFPDGDPDNQCLHLKDTNSSFESLCLPLIGSDETFGVLSLQAPHSSEQYFNRHTQDLARSCADSITLALTNLRLRDRLMQQSTRDPLTNLFNRRYLGDTLEKEIHRAGRNHSPLCVIMLEVDNFKIYNNTYGHAAGDYVLCMIAETISSNLRRSDFPCRYGGDEFTLLLPETSVTDGARRADAIRQAIESMQLVYGDQPLGKVTVRMGVAAYPKHGNTGDTILRAADDASYKARAAGKNSVVVAD